MSSFWGLPTIVTGGPLLNPNRHLEVQFFEGQKGLKSSGRDDEEGEVSEGEISSADEAIEILSSSDEGEKLEAKPKISATKPLLGPSKPQAKPTPTVSAPKKVPVVQKPVVKQADSEEEEGAVSSGSDSESGEMETAGSDDEESQRKRQAEQEVRADIMSRGLPVSKKQLETDAQKQIEVKPKSKKRKQATQDQDQDDLPQMKEPKKPLKQLKCYSEKDVDYRAMWKEQSDATKAPPNHPFFQISVRNVRTKPYCDLWESEEKKDYLYYKPGTWDHVKDVPRLTEDNLSKLSIAEAKQFVTWLLAERKVANGELQSLRRRIWAETDRYRRVRGYISGQKQLPAEASAVKAAMNTINNPTLVTSDGLLIVAPKEQKRLLQGFGKLWMTEETSNLLKQKQRVYAKMKKRGTEFFKNKFKELDRLCRAEVKKAKQHWENYMMDCMRQNGIIVGSILEECVERVATGNIPPDPRLVAAHQRRMWQSQRGGGGGRGRGGGPSWAQRGRGGRPQRGKSRADDLQL